MFVVSRSLFVVRVFVCLLAVCCVLCVVCCSVFFLRGSLIVGCCVLRAGCWLLLAVGNW